MDNLNGSAGRIFLAALLIGAGVILLALRQFGWLAEGSWWPFTIILPGVALLVLAAVTPGGAARGLAAGGAVVTTVGLILLVMMLTRRFEAWAYAWALLPTAAGAGFYAIAARDGDRVGAARAAALMQTGAVMFVLFAAAFEGLIFNGVTGLGTLFLPVGLIVLGLVVLLRGGMFGGNGRGRSAGDPKGPPAAV